jgi:Gly-Xaa carboxypeptidase
VLDEGFTGVDEAYGRTFARFGTAEKGAVSIKLDVLTPGGHASVPRRGHTGIGILAKLVSVLEEHPDVPRLRTGNPLLGELQCAAQYGEVDKKWRKRVQDPKQWKKLGREMAEEDDIARAYLGTTQATDLIHGGVKMCVRLCG